MIFYSHQTIKRFHPTFTQLTWPSFSAPLLTNFFQALSAKSLKFFYQPPNTYFSEPAGRALDPVGRASKQAKRASEPLQRWEGLG